MDVIDRCARHHARSQIDRKSRANLPGTIYIIPKEKLCVGKSKIVMLKLITDKIRPHLSELQHDIVQDDVVVMLSS